MNNNNAGNKNETAKARHVPFYVPLLNPVMKTLLLLGIPMGSMKLLTVKGRTSGRPRTTPVGVLEHDGHCYVFGTFGKTNWVRNLRASGEAVLTQGRHHQKVRAVELTLQEASLILQEVLAPYLESRVGRSFLHMGYDLEQKATTDDFVREAQRHPGFELKYVHDN